MPSQFAQDQAQAAGRVQDSAGFFRSLFRIVARQLSDELALSSWPLVQKARDAREPSHTSVVFQFLGRNFSDFVSLIVLKKIAICLDRVQAVSEYYRG